MSAWRDSAACIDADTHLFFPGENERHWSPAAGIAICATCDVRAECLAEALDNHEFVGVFGGVDFGAAERERTAAIRRRHGGYAVSPWRLDVQRLARKGHTARAIAAELGLSKRHVQRFITEMADDERRTA